VNSAFRVTTRINPAAVLGPLRAESCIRAGIFGASVRRRSQGLLRYGIKPSRPGQPPTVHRSRRGRQSYSPLRERIFYAVEDVDFRTVVGPELLPGKQGAGSLEEGGPIRLSDGRTVSIERRPFMLPALMAELPGVPDLWANAISN